MWDSLWSARRHARIDVLDVVLFDEVSAGEREAAASSPSLSIESSTPPCPGMRWLFTAKNGQIMKKSSHNTSLGALKQALLDRALLRRGSSEGKSISAYPTNGPHSSNSSVAGGCVFATALLRSGESVPLNEDSWTALVVREGGREGGAVAVIALAPTGGGQGVETSRRGGATPQRFTCEYRAKLNNRRTPLARAKSVAATGLAVTEKPIEASMATYVLVARGLLRDADGQQSEPRHDQDEEKHHARGEAIETGTSATAIVLDERLLSRAKATNREVEATLRAVVQWVQDTRGVYVLSMAATFIVVPPSGNSAGKPQVWLEQALQVRMVHKNGTAPAPMHAPIAEPPRVGSVDRQDPVAACHGEKFSEQEEGGTACRPSTEGSDNAIVRVGTTKTTSAPPAPSASDAGGTATSLQRPPLPPLPMTTASASADHLPGAGAQLKSTAEMLSAVADAVLSASQSPGTTAMQAQPLRSTDGAIVDAAQLQQDTVGGARGNWRRPLAAATVRVKCSGDFCAYYGGGGEGPGPPERLPPKDTLLQDSTGTAVDSNREAASRDGKVEAGVDWTDVGMSDGKSGAALLEVRNKRQGPPLPGDTEPDKDSRGMLFSLMFKSVGLARVEAKQGRDAYWGEDLRRCWRESGCRAAGGLEELSPALIYQEVRLVSALLNFRRSSRPKPHQNRQEFIQVHVQLQNLTTSPSSLKSRQFPPSEITTHASMLELSNTGVCPHFEEHANTPSQRSDLAQLPSRRVPSSMTLSHRSRTTCEYWTTACQRTLPTLRCLPFPILQGGCMPELLRGLPTAGQTEGET